MIQSSHSTPQIFISGRIKEACEFDSNEMFLKVLFEIKKFEFIFGTNFRVIEGNIKGETFQTISNNREKSIPLDHPFSFNLAAKSIKGWPKLIIEAWSTDKHGRNSLIGYGLGNIPFCPGFHIINIYCWRPSLSSKFSWTEEVLGCTPEFVDKSAVYSVDEKFGMNTISTGFVVVEMDIILKDFQLHGIEINNTKYVTNNKLNF